MADKKKRVKSTLIALVIILVLATISSWICLSMMEGSSIGIMKPSQPTDLSVDEITEQVKAALDISDITKIDKENISYHYSLPDGLVSDISLYVANSSDVAFEMGCFKLSTDRYKEQIQSVVASHMATKASGFETINPEGYALYKDYLIEQVGVYTFVFVGQNKESAQNEFRRLMTS